MQLQDRGLAEVEIPGSTWKRPGISTSASPRRTSCIATGSSSVPSAQIAAAAFAS